MMMMMMMMMMMTRMKDDRSANDHEDDINFISLQLKVDIALSLKFLFLLYQVYNPADLFADLFADLGADLPSYAKEISSSFSSLSLCPTKEFA